MFCCKEQISQKDIMKMGAIGGFLEIIYVLIIVGLFSFLDKVLPEPPEFFGFLFMLLLFVFSAGISGVFVFGYPAYLAVQKKFKEAFATVFVTFSVMFTVLVLLLLINLVFNN